MREKILAISILAGTIIGAGVFALPYVFARLGLWLGTVYLFFFAFIYFAVHLMYAELLQKHGGKHEFFYMAHRYLPNWVAEVASFAIIAELVLVLTAYLALIPSFLGFVLPVGILQIVLIFWFLGTVFMFLPNKAIGGMEAVGILGVFVILFLLFAAGGISGFQAIRMTPKNFGWAEFALPFGPLLFALSGRPALSRVIDLWKKRGGGGKFSLKSAVFWGTFLPAIVYFIFVAVTLRIAPNPQPDVISSLYFLPGQSLVVLGVLGFLTLFTSYFVMGINVREIIGEDIGWSKLAGAVIAIFAPLAIYFLSSGGFFRIISFTGGVFLGLEAIFVIAMWQRAFRLSRLRRAAFLLYPVFLLAMGYEVWGFVKGLGISY